MNGNGVNEASIRMHGAVVMSGLMGDGLGFPRRGETILMVRMLAGEVWKLW